MRRTVLGCVVAVTFVAIGCTSSDPTASDEYAVIEKDLIETRRELQKAIQREEYERAASLRDRIHALESEIGGGDDD